MYKACILIIEDNQLIREIERATLENAGFRNFVLAANGNLGLEAAYSYRPDIIVCDLNLPDLRGDQFQTELISNPDFHRVPIVFVSAQSNKDLIFELRKKGAVAYLTKPVDATELVLNVELHLGKFLDFKRLAFQTQHDELTGLHNRRNVLEQILSRFAQRNYQDNAILLLDIDHLRAINEQYGHQSGDLVLSTVGAVLRQNLRPYDLLGRYGGEEFIIMLPCTNAQGAIAAAEKIRQRLKDLRIPLSAEPVTITVSIGITTLHHHADFLAKELNIDSMFELFECPASPQLNWSYIESLKSKVALKLIELANQAMSHAKIKGRNQICLGDPTGTNTL